MVKKYVTTLKNGAKEQKAFILGRSIILRDGEVVSEGILTKTFPSLFEEIIDVKVKNVNPAPSKAEEQLLIDDSSDVVVSEEIGSQDKSAETSKKPEAKKTRSTKATKDKWIKL